MGLSRSPYSPFSGVHAFDMILTSRLPRRVRHPIRRASKNAHPDLSCPIDSLPTLSYPILSHPILSYRILSYHIP